MQLGILCVTYDYLYKCYPVLWWLLSYVYNTILCAYKDFVSVQNYFVCVQKCFKRGSIQDYLIRIQTLLFTYKTILCTYKRFFTHTRHFVRLRNSFVYVHNCFVRAHLQSSFVHVQIILKAEKRFS